MLRLWFDSLFYGLGGAKLRLFWLIRKFFFRKVRIIQKNAVPLHPLSGNRDVAQLVAHYVRDVGVGRSSRLIPTNRKMF